MQPLIPSLTYKNTHVRVIDGTGIPVSDALIEALGNCKPLAQLRQLRGHFCSNPLKLQNAD